MSIRVECGSCRSSFTVKDEFGGKKGKCPHCRGPVTVPSPATERVGETEPRNIYALADAPKKVRTAASRLSATASHPSPAVSAVAPARPTRTPMEILAAFRGEIRPVRPTLLYRLWVVIVAGVMVLLPLVYVALIGAVLYVLYLHAVYDAYLLRHARNVKLVFLLYAGPLVIGLVVVGFMLKPLFAPPGRRGKPKELDPSKEPLIFAFVDGVCSCVGAPRPSRIEVDCQVNASASLGEGRFAWLGNDLVLTIGLPLVAGLDLRQFAGVLAHEFGHFSQRAGMRVNSLIRAINHWFARVVYERDEWDETLVAWTQDDSGLIILLGVLARLAVWLTRRVLWVLMMVGHAMSSFLSRQQEFDADRYEARMVGGKVFAQTSSRLIDLNAAENQAVADLSESWRERRLPDNLPRLILAKAVQMPGAMREVFQQLELGRKTGLFETHPATKDRIARAAAEQTDGIFKLGGPATDLFRDFDGLAHSASLKHYRAVLGPQVTKDDLYPVAELVQNQEVAQQGYEASGRFFLNALAEIQPLPLSALHPQVPADLKAAKRTLITARGAMQAARGANQGAWERWNGVFESLVNAEAAVVLAKAGHRIKAAQFGLNGADPEDAAQSARDELQALAQETSRFETAAARRIETALGLLESEAVMARVPEGTVLRDEARALYPSAAHLGDRVAREFPALMEAQHVVRRVGQVYHDEKKEKNETAINALIRAGRQLHDRLHEFQWKVGNVVEYPFEHASEGIGIGRYALPLIPDRDALGDLHTVAGEAIERLTGLYARVVGRLALVAEEVERAVGLPPLQEPDGVGIGVSARETD